jgi:hypothetical protein
MKSKENNKTKQIAIQKKKKEKKVMSNNEIFFNIFLNKLLSNDEIGKENKQKKRCQLVLTFQTCDLDY